MDVGGGRLGHFELKTSFGGNGWRWVVQGYAISHSRARNHHRSLGQTGEEENSLSVELEIPMDEKALSGARNGLSKTTLFRQTLPHA